MTSSVGSLAPFRLISPARHDACVGASRRSHRLLAETATLDAGLAQQLAVLLLGHTLAALLDDRAHPIVPLNAYARSHRRKNAGHDNMLARSRVAARPPDRKTG